MVEFDFDFRGSIFPMFYRNDFSRVPVGNGVKTCLFKWM